MFLFNSSTHCIIAFLTTVFIQFPSILPLFLNEHRQHTELHNITKNIAKSIEVESSSSLIKNIHQFADVWTNCHWFMAKFAPGPCTYLELVARPSLSSLLTRYRCKIKMLPSCSHAPFESHRSISLKLNKLSTILMQLLISLIQ